MSSGAPSDPGSDSTVAQGDSGATRSPPRSADDELAAIGDADLKEGDPVGEYVVAAKVGEGGFGTVFRAVHPVIDKEVAIKVLKRKYSSDREIVSRFVAEARAVNQIGHRNIVDIFAFGRLADGRQYYVMTFLRGESLHERLQRQAGKRLAPEAARPVLHAVAEALDAAHAAGFAHRDLKPANVFLGEDGATKLLDFGVAKLFTAEGDHRTETGAPIGTPNYMSPEQARGQRVDHRTDVYSFGVLAYQLLTGRLPFEGGSVIDIALKHVQDTPPAPSTRLPGLSAELDRAILWMLEKQPGDRPQSVGEAMRALDTAMGYEPDDGPVVAPTTARRRGPFVPPGAVGTDVAHAETVAPPTEPQPPPRRAPRAAMIAGGIVLAAGLIAIGWRITRQPSDPPRRAPAPAPAPAPAVVVGPDAGVPLSPTVAIVVSTMPRDATVKIDGVVIDHMTELPRDHLEHTLEVSKPGHMTFTRTFVFDSASATLAYDVELAPEAPPPAAAGKKGKKQKPPGKDPGSGTGTGTGTGTGSAAVDPKRDPARGIRIDEL